MSSRNVVVVVGCFGYGFESDGEQFLGERCIWLIVDLERDLFG